MISQAFAQLQQQNTFSFNSANLYKNSETAEMNMQFNIEAFQTMRSLQL